MAFIDGYAGPGGYEDGEEGSSAMLLRKAKELARLRRQAECRGYRAESRHEFRVPLDEVASFDQPSGYGTPATEVLINLTASLRRFGGILNSVVPVEVP